jgi:hypothetical protein
VGLEDRVEVLASVNEEIAATERKVLSMAEYETLVVDTVAMMLCAKHDASHEKSQAVRVARELLASTKMEEHQLELIKSTIIHLVSQHQLEAHWEQAAKKELHDLHKQEEILEELTSILSGNAKDKLSRLEGLVHNLLLAVQIEYEELANHATELRLKAGSLRRQH